MEKTMREIVRNAKMTLEKAEVNYKEVSQIVGATEKKDDLLAAEKHLSIVKNAEYLENIPAKYGLANVLDLGLDVYVESEYGSTEVINFKERLFQSDRAYSPYYRHLREILDRDPRDGFETAELIGKVLEIEIVHNRVGNRTYANIGSVRAVDVENIKEVM